MSNRLSVAARLFFALLCCAGGLSAQEAVISGHITNAEGDTLTGATIRVVGSVIGTTTNLDGHYELELPPGNIRMLYSYVGYENFDTIFTVGVAEREINVDVVMSEAFLETGEIIIYGRRSAGQAEALRNQKVGQVAQTIIHSETFNKYPDVTIAETTARMPGVSIIRSVTDGEIISLRGLPEQYTAVSLNGQRLPSIQPEVDQSGRLDIIQSNLVDEVRVIKARSADMDGDAIAGSVDFRIRHPEDKFEFLLQAGQGQNFGFDENPDQNTGITQLAGTINSELADEKVYALASASYLSQGRGTRTELYDYNNAAGPTNTVQAAYPFDTDRQTQRFGFVGAIELRPSIYNRMRLSYNRSQVKEEVAQRQLLAGTAVDDQVRRLSSGWENQRTLSIVTLEVENNFPKTRLDYQLSFSQNAEELNDRLRSIHVADDLDPGGDQLTDLTPNSAVATGPLGFSATLRDRALLEETVAIGSMNITRYLNRQRTSLLKVGGRYRSKDREYGAGFSRLGQAGSPAQIEPGTFAGIPTIIPIEEDSLMDLPQLYDAKQRIAAAYAMYAANFSAKLSMTLGARYEYLRVEARDAADTLSFDNSNLLPSLNLTYRMTRDQQIRFSYYQAVGRPSYATYRPESSGVIQLINIDQFSRPMPDIEQSNSNNIDLAFERYGKRDGMFSIGIYAKFLNNPTVLTQTTDYFTSSPSAPVNLGRPTFVNQVINANDASVLGFELGFYQSLGFLQERLRYINVNGTYNFNAYSVDNPAGIDDDLPLAQAPRQSANLSFVYSNPNTRLNLVAAANFRDRVFDRLLDERALYRNRLLTVDLSADYEVIKDISVYLRANNLTNAAFEEWFGKPNGDDSLLRSSAKYGRWGVVGVRYRPG